MEIEEKFFFLNENCNQYNKIVNTHNFQGKVILMFKVVKKIE